MPENIFARRLKELRKSHNLTLEQLGGIFSISKQAVGHWETSIRFPPIDVLISLANYFCVSIDYLTGRSDDPRYEDFIDKAEAVFFSEAEKLIECGINADVMSRNEELGAEGDFMKNYYIIHSQKYTAPLARLRIMFRAREVVRQHLSHLTVKVKIPTPKDFRKASLLNPKAYLKERGVLPYEIPFYPTLGPSNPGEKSPRELFIEELDKLQEEYIQSKNLPTKGTP